jgi:predicted nuclease with TOPRIM domain
MPKPKAQTSQRFSRAARAEQGRLERKRSQLHERREGLQAKVDGLDEELEALNQHLARLQDFARSGSDAIEIRRIEPRDEGDLELLSGSRIRALAVPLLIRDHGLGPIHYKDWYALLNKHGYGVAGKRPDAVFLNQIARSPLVRSTTKSGYYALDLNAVEQLREKLREQQTAMGELMADIPNDSMSFEAHRTKQREMSIAIGRTERNLDEAIHAIESAKEAGSAASEELPRAEAA